MPLGQSVICVARLVRLSLDESGRSKPLTTPWASAWCRTFPDFVQAVLSPSSCV